MVFWIIHELYACGGLPGKNPLLMQIFADVSGRHIKVAASDQTVALGSAMFAAVAAGAFDADGLMFSITAVGAAIAPAAVGAFAATVTAPLAIAGASEPAAATRTGFVASAF